MISVVVPARNEAGNISGLLAALARAVHVPLEVIVVVDTPDDPTVQAVERLALDAPFPLRTVKNELGSGPANALRTGFLAAAGDAVVVLMGDLSDELTLIDRMVQQFEAGYDLVCASRYMRGGQQVGGPLMKRTLSRLAGLSLHFFGLPVHDPTNSFKLYRTSKLKLLPLKSCAGFEISLEITVKAWRQGWKIIELPTRWVDRTAGHSKFRMWRWLPGYLRWYGYAIGCFLRGRDAHREY
jgi:dolichol-phosphate mannosyltransferase